MLHTTLFTNVMKRMNRSASTCIRGTTRHHTTMQEVTNVTAQKLYQNHFGFIREELLVRYYLNCGDAYRLRLWF
jgi:ribosomal protein S18 acetylase RimI-like enzyme